MLCDRPNVLNGTCDPDSKFQMIPSGNPNIFTAAHCRKKGRPEHFFGDIAVIQYNLKTGATCFFQSPVTLTNVLPAAVPSPSKGLGDDQHGGTQWLPPSGPGGVASINCVSCHDNGPFIRSPYLAHMKDDPLAFAAGNFLPGTHDFAWNKTQPYRFVGSNFQSWKVFSIVTPDTLAHNCVSCHRMGLSASNGVFNKGGTSINFGLIATAATQAQKNSSADIWMKPDQHSYDMAVEQEAGLYNTAANALITFEDGGSAPDASTSWAEYGQGTTCKGEQFKTVINGATQSDPQGPVDEIIPIGFCNNAANCRRGFVYWTTLHGPFWQTTGNSIGVDDPAYRGSGLRVETDATGIFQVHHISHPISGLAPAPGGTIEGTGYDEFVTSPPVLTNCSSPFDVLLDTDGTHLNSSANMGAANHYFETLTGMIGNVAQLNGSAGIGGLPTDSMTVSSTASTFLTQGHRAQSGAPFIGPLEGSSWPGQCTGYTPTYVARNVLSQNDVLLVSHTAASGVRCFISGIRGAWSSTRSGGTIQPFAQIYRNGAGDIRLAVGPTDSGTPVDRVSAYASCFKL